MNEEVIKKIENLGNDIFTQIKAGQNPAMDIPIRSISNVEYDREKRMLILKDAKSKRYFAHIAHARKFMQTLLVAAQCKKILEQDVHTSIRDLYYSVKHTIPGTNEVTFEEQKESDPIIEDIEVTINALREQLNLNANRKGFMVGDITLVDTGDTIDASKLGSGGYAIPSNVEEDVIQFKKTKQ